MRRWILLAPLLFFLVMAGTFLYALNSGDPSKLPSALLNKPVPEFSLPPIEGLMHDGKAVEGFSNETLGNGQARIVNVWASWCGPCHTEHPLLMKLAARDDIQLFGINYKDKPVAARRFLGQLGNPYVAVGADSDGRTAINWGVYGVPETYVVDGAGRIAYKHVGPITEKVLTERILPAFEKAQKPSDMSSKTGL